MGNRPKIIESNFDTLQFERAFVTEDPHAPGHFVPRAVVSGIECDIQSKPTLIEDGLAFCEPINNNPYWPVYTLIERNGTVRRFDRLTNHPKIVAAAARFNAVLASGQLSAVSEL